MNFIRKSFITIVLLSIHYLSLAQEADSLRSYYPLHIGNTWLYEDQTIREIETHKIMGDTLINECLYYIFQVTWSNPAFSGRRYYRTVNDSLWVVEYEENLDDGNWQEVTVYKLSAEVGESWEVRPDYPTSLKSKEMYDIFNESRNALFYDVFNGFFTHEEILVEGLGFIGRFNAAGEVSTTILQGAIINGQIYGNVSSVKHESPSITADFTLYQNYPNPFNNNTIIPFQTTKDHNVTISICNILGKIVKVVIRKEMPPGNHKVPWDGTDQQGYIVNSGVYYVRVTIEPGHFLINKIVFIK